MRIAINLFVALVVAVPANALDAVGEGRRAWLKLNCSGCHGARGGGGMGPNIVYEADEVYEAMNEGEKEHGMISYSGVKVGGQAVNVRLDASNITQYLNSIAAGTDPTWVDWWNPTPSLCSISLAQQGLQRNCGGR